MSFLKFEFKRIFRDKKNIIFLVFIMIISFYYLSIGVNEFNHFLKERENFLKYEKQKVEHYKNYVQYSGYGFRVLFELSTSNVFFVNSTIFKDIESNIDVTDIINVFHSFKGKNLFSHGPELRDFSGIIFLFGSLFMLFMGARVISGKEYFRFLLNRMSYKRAVLSSVLSRILILNSIFSLLFVLSYLFVIIQNIHLRSDSINSFFHFCIYGLIFLNFFYFTGILMKILSKFKIVSYLWIFIIWFASIYIVPEITRSYLVKYSQDLPSNEEVNMKKLKTIMDFETKAFEIIRKRKYNNDQIQKMLKKLAFEYRKNEFLLNRSRELALKQKVEELIFSYEELSLLFPSLFYSFTVSEMSSKGYYGYLDFLDYIMKMRWNFMDFYLKKRYGPRFKKVQSFVKTDENIFKAKSHIPQTFWVGFGITFFYCALLFVVSYILLKRRIYK